MTVPTQYMMARALGREREYLRWLMEQCYTGDRAHLVDEYFAEHPNLTDIEVHNGIGMMLRAGFGDQPSLLLWEDADRQLAEDLEAAKPINQAYANRLLARVAKPHETGEYVIIPQEYVPRGMRWDVPQGGQAVEVAYAYPGRGSAPAGPGDPYRRTTDSTLRKGHPERVTYAIRLRPNDPSLSARPMHPDYIPGLGRRTVAEQ